MNHKKTSIPINKSSNISYDIVVFYLDRNMKIISKTDNFESILKKISFIHITEGKLNFRDTKKSNEINKLISKKEMAKEQKKLRFFSKDGNVQWLIEVLLISGREFKNQDLSQKIIISINNIYSASPEFEQGILKELFKLTYTEERICYELTKGLSLIESAKKVGISYEHARQRIKVIFSKTSTSSQTQLISTLIKLSFSLTQQHLNLSNNDSDD